MIDIMARFLILCVLTVGIMGRFVRSIIYREPRPYLTTIAPSTPPQKCIDYYKDPHAHHSDNPYNYQKMTASRMIEGRRSNANELERIAHATGTRFIVMHGSLIGQRFNSDFLPWDDDLDVDVLSQDVDRLKQWTRKHATGCSVAPESEKTKYYEWYNLSSDFCMYIDNDKHHHIEMRLVHSPTSIYTDIMFLYQRERKFVMKAILNHLWGGHVYPFSKLLPLQPCSLGLAKLWCPAKPIPILNRQYGAKWASKHQKGHVFDELLQCWTKRL